MIASTLEPPLFGGQQYSYRESHFLSIWDQSRWGLGSTVWSHPSRSRSGSEKMFMLRRRSLWSTGFGSVGGIAPRVRRAQKRVRPRATA